MDPHRCHRPDHCRDPAYRKEGRDTVKMLVLTLILTSLGCYHVKPPRPIATPPELITPTDCEQIFDDGDTEANRCPGVI